MRDVVVVGSSAGGIRALRGLLAAVPADLAASILVVNHIPSSSPSILPSILGAAATLTVKAAEDGERMAHGCVYVASPDRHLMVEHGRLRLSHGPRENRVRPCVDTLFRSAAVDLGPRVIGIVLSGTLDDGTAGLWAVKDRGGIAIVQRPAEAEYPDMPENALRNVAVDHVLSVAEIGARLGELVREPTAAPTRVPETMAAEVELELHGSALANGVLALGRPSPNACPECHGSLVEIKEGSVVRYRCHTGHSFSMRSLMAETELSIERSLWNAVRAIEERSFLLRSMERNAREDGDVEGGERFAAAADRDEANAQGVRALIVGSSPAH
jgi:two-component system chemotaxis response regulator CheB